MIALQTSVFPDHNLDRAVSRLVLEGISEFPSILRALQGVFPSTALESLQRLSGRGIIPKAVELRALEYVNAFSTPCSSDSGRSNLPVPHPLDFDWRFEKNTVKNLSDYSLDLTIPGDTIVFLGTPTLYFEALTRHRKRHYVLIDRNLEYTKKRKSTLGRVYGLDLLRDMTPSIEAKVVVADPPWYPTYESYFLWIASKLCTLGGHVLVTFPPSWTRPGIDSENNQLFDLSGKFGLKILQCLTDFAIYDSPYFERNALRHCGIDNYPANWRRGHLVLFQKLRHPPSIYTGSVEKEETWISCPFGIKVKRETFDETNLVDPRLKSIIAGDVLPSVSRRDERRKQANVWTIGNRIYRCNGTTSLRHTLLALSQGKSPHHAVESWLGRPITKTEKLRINEVIGQIRGLTKLETRELLNED